VHQLTTREPGLGSSFRKLWFATGSSNLADGIMTVGVPLIAVTLTRSPLLISLAAVLSWLPWLLISLYAGVAADRYDRRRIMMLATTTRVALLAVVTVIAVSGTLSLPVLYLTVLIVGTAAVFSDTSAQSLLPMLVEREHLGKANGRLVAAQTVANQFLGAPIAGVLVGIASALIFGVAGACFGVAAVLLWSIRGQFRVTTPSTRSVRADIGAGLRYLWSHKVLRSMASGLGLLNLGGGAYSAVLVLWVVGDQSRIGMPEVGYGIAMGAIGVGAVLGSVLVERVTRVVSPALALSAALLIMPVMLLLPVVLPLPAVLIVAMVPYGVGSGFVNVIMVTTRQRIVPDDVLGRTNASYRMVGLGAIPLGALIGGMIGEVASVQTALLAGVAFCVAAAAAVARNVTPTTLRDAEHAG
jgi:MFS family permease